MRFSLLFGYLLSVERRAVSNHELAKLLLEREEMPVLVPKTKTFDESGELQDVIVQEFEAELVEGGKEKVMLILGFNPNNSTGE